MVLPISKIILMVGLMMVTAGLAWWDNQNPSEQSEIIDIREEQLSEGESDFKPELELVVSPTPLLVTKIPRMPSPTHSPTQVPQTFVNGNLADWKYPSSEVIEQTQYKLVMTSSDEAQAVTEWYQGRSKNEQWQARTSVTTQANDKVENRLVFARGGEEISISISQEDARQLVTILVEFR